MILQWLLSYSSKQENKTIPQKLTENRQKLTQSFSHIFHVKLSHAFAPKPLATSFNPNAELCVHFKNVTKWAKHKPNGKNSNEEGRELVLLKLEPLQNSQDFKRTVGNFHLDLFWIFVQLCQFKLWLKHLMGHTWLNSRHRKQCTLLQWLVHTPNAKMKLKLMLNSKPL